MIVRLMILIFMPIFSGYAGEQQYAIAPIAVSASPLLENEASGTQAWLPASAALFSSERQSVVPATRKTRVRGCISLAGDHGQVPEITILFDGMTVKSDVNGLFSFPWDGEEPLTSFHIIFCKKVIHQFQKKKTIEHLKLAGDKRSRVFSCTRVRDGQRDVWQWQEEKPVAFPYILPDRALIVLLDEKYIDHLEQWKLVIGKNNIMLPRIVLKGDRKKIMRAAHKSTLNSLDLRHFHEPIKSESKDIGGGKGKMRV